MSGVLPAVLPECERSNVLNAEDARTFSSNANPARLVSKNCGHMLLDLSTGVCYVLVTRAASLPRDFLTYGSWPAERMPNKPRFLERVCFETAQQLHALIVLEVGQAQ